MSGAKSQAWQDATDAKLGRDAKSLLPGSAYMDPPDGGDVTVFEQLQRMAADAELWRFLLRTANESTHECEVMKGLTERFEAHYDLDPPAAFAAHVVAGLAAFKAEVH